MINYEKIKELVIALSWLCEEDVSDYVKFMLQAMFDRDFKTALDFHNKIIAKILIKLENLGE